MAEQKTFFTSPFTPLQLERAFAPLVEKGPLQVQEVLTGNINTILKIEHNGRVYGLRVRTQASVYRYEPDLIKEVFVLRLLQQVGKEPNDARVAAMFRSLCEAQCGTVNDRSDGFPSLRYFDWSKRFLPHPYCIYEWVDGAPLVDAPEPRLYAQAGRVLARIHQVRLSAFYADFLSIDMAPTTWSERYRAALAKESQAAKPGLSRRVGATLDSLNIPAEAPCLPCLVHNDFAPGNILTRDGRIAAVIDWDNAVIEAPHLDFVKMKYWTAKNRDGEFTHHPELFSAFVDGYGPGGRAIIGSSVFVLYEVLWLLRVLNFERSKEKQGLARTPGYPAARAYEEYLGKVLSTK